MKYIICKSKKKFDRRRPAAVPPPQSGKRAVFLLFTNILQYFPLKIVFKIVKDKFWNTQDQKLPAAARRHTPPPAVTKKFKRNYRYIVMGVDFGVIWAADFDNAIRFHVRRPARRLRVTRRPPSHQNSKEMTDISSWVSILGLFGPLISIKPFDFMSAALPAGYGSPTDRRHTKILRKQ